MVIVIGLISTRWRLSARLSLAQQFMLASLNVLVVGALSVSGWVGQQIERGVLDRIASETALFVDSFVDPPLQELGRGSSLTAQHVAALNKLLDETLLGQHIVAFKVWDTQGRVVYSTNPALSGQVFPIKDELARSISGEVVAAVTDLQDEENVLERGRYWELMEIYSPVAQNGTNRIIPVVELSQTVNALTAEIQSAQRSTWLLFAQQTAVVVIRQMPFSFRHCSNTDCSESRNAHYFWLSPSANCPGIDNGT